MVVRVETVKLPSAETAAGARGTNNSFVLITALYVPLLVGEEARVSRATSAQCLSGAWTDSGLCSFRAGSSLYGGLCEEQPGAPLTLSFLCQAGGDTVHLVV